jgi:cobyrinic acid a,c-diamide synthase
VLRHLLRGNEVSDDKINQMSDDSIIAIPLRNLLAIIFSVAVAVVGYFEVTNRISLTERHIGLMEQEVELNSNFRIGWPLGEFGALPTDAEQNRELLALKDRMAMMWEEIEENDTWIDEYEAPEEVQEAVDRTMDLKVELAYMTIRVEHLEALMESKLVIGN